MTLYDYESVPYWTGVGDEPTEAAVTADAERVQALQADGFEVYDATGGAYNLRRERAPEAAMATVLGARTAGALVAAGVPDLAAAEAMSEAELAALPGVGPSAVQAVKRTAEPEGAPAAPAAPKPRRGRARS